MNGDNDGDMQARVDEVIARRDAACTRAGRDPSEVTLVAVAKTYGPEAVASLARCGISVIGENRVQEARQKIPLCPGDLRWHLVGHLQRNKVRHAVGLFEMIHAVDSARLLEALDEACSEAGVTMPVCLEVNISGEAAKFGLAPEDVIPALDLSSRLPHLDVMGLMTVPSFSPDAEDARPYFRRLRELRDGWAASSGFPLAELSMGMSGDFEVAIEEGATLIRVGSALFGPRTRP